MGTAYGAIRHLLCEHAVFLALLLLAVVAYLLYMYRRMRRTIRERTAALEAANLRLQEEMAVRRQAEEVIRREQTLFRQMVDLNPHAILVTDGLGRAQLANGRVREFFGEIPSPGTDVLAAADRREPGLADRIRALRPGEVITPQDFRQETGEDGLRRSRCLRTAAFPIHAAGGGVEHYVLMFEDETEARTLQEQLIQSERLAAVGTLSAGVAHEFNNIHASMLGFLDLALEGLPRDAEASRYLERVRRSVLRAVTITRHLLSFSAQREGSFSDVDLADLVRDVLVLTEGRLRSDGVALDLDLRPVPRVQADPARVAQVLTNLLANAEHALLEREDRRIRVSTRAEADGVLVEVRDNGRGMTTEELRRIFTPFYSTKGEHAAGMSPQSKVKGVGLGLSVSQAIARLHGGELRVESAPGKGSAFTLVLPLPPRRDAGGG